MRSYSSVCELALTRSNSQMAEGIAIRTFIKLKVLEAIPTTGSISLQDLAKATGAEESLLGTSIYFIRNYLVLTATSERMARILGERLILMRKLSRNGAYIIASQLTSLACIKWPQDF